MAIARAKTTCCFVQRQVKVGVSHLSLFSLFLLHTHIVCVCLCECVCMLRQPVSGFSFFFFNFSSSLLLLIFSTDFFSVSVLDIFLYSILTECYTSSAKHHCVYVARDDFSFRPNNTIYLLLQPFLFFNFFSLSGLWINYETRACINMKWTSACACACVHVRKYRYFLVDFLQSDTLYSFTRSFALNRGIDVFFSHTHTFWHRLCI